MAKKEKKPEYKTPIGEFLYPWLNQYDDREFDGKPQKPAWKLTIKYDAKGKAWLGLKDKLDALVETSYAEAVANNPKKKKEIGRAYPYEMETDDEGEETGNVKLKLKQNAFFTDKKTDEEVATKVWLYDATMRPIDRTKVKIFGGSTGLATFTVRPYFMQSSNKAGISLDLRSVQVATLVTRTERSAESFGLQRLEGYEGIETAEEEEAPAEEVLAEADATDF